ncbi:hypothetical protein TSUD_261230 [Trifolium subterraneum]|uniref:AB hydrolase-1 domain-containing protein n=1 Tax=Trifolium subterraneum TaxID=3900 RepID=A0A2Z6NQU6_TRISU|nr:hypothetical protein TSUD_261230 [Trifolium subterraneum]
MAKGGQCLFEKVRRCIRTVFFVIALVVSLIVTSLPVVVAVVDILVPFVLISNFTCVKCYSFKQHFHRYSFKSSLMDIPLVSLLRSFIIICVYSICDGPALSHGPYLGTVTLCSFSSIVLLSVKACVFTVNSQIEAEASVASLKRQRLHLKKSWGMPVLFLSSVVFALGHTVVAYRTSCRARRKLLFHRVDPESVLSCKSVFSGYPKVPRSPTPSGGRTPKSDSEMRRRPFGTTRDEELQARLLADSDSFFITCQGLSLHYKLSLPGSPPPHTLSSISCVESNSSYSISSVAGGLEKLDGHRVDISPKIEPHLYRSYSNHINGSSLYAPLLDSNATSVFSEDIPIFHLDGISEENGNSKLDSLPLEQNIGQLGVVFIHGFGGGVFSWRHVMGSLAREINCAVAAFDRPGWGLSSRPRREDWEAKELPNPYKLDSQIDMLLSFCSEIGFSSVVLIGHDDGGLLALMAAQRVTIKGVVLLNVSLSREVVPSFARILLHTSLGKKHMVRPLLRMEITQVVNRRAWYDATKLTTEVLDLYKAPLSVQGWDEAVHEIGKLSSETILSAKNAESLLQAVEDIPVLVIAGAEDSLVSLKSCQAMASKLENSRLVAISGCGHLPHEECPKALLAAISPFISRLLSASDSQS